MMTIKEARALISSIIALRNSVTDEQALTMLNIFPTWKADYEYTEGTRLVYGGMLYRVLTTHMSGGDNTPATDSELYSVISV